MQMHNMLLCARGSPLSIYQPPISWNVVSCGGCCFCCLKKIESPYNYKVLDVITKYVPLVAGVMYTVVAAAYFAKKDYGWGVIWVSYATANFALMVVGNQ